MRVLLPLAAILVLTACVPGDMPVTPAAAPVAASAVSATGEAGSFGAALGDLRRSRGLAPLAQDPELTAAAQAHAQELAARGATGHRGGDGSSSGDRARRAGCDWRAAAENTAAGQTSVAQVMQSWAASPSHSANILGPAYTRYGLGRAGTIWVLMVADRC